MLFYKVKRGTRIAGVRVGYNGSKGYRKLKIGRIEYPEHRIIWAMLRGNFSKDLEIDHINHIKDDNRIENLRLATRGQNRVNAINSKNKHGYKGIYYDPQKKRYLALTKINGVKIRSKRYKTALEAHLAYVDIIKKHFGEFCPF